jgi:Flp pilus assembly secretin CpaC
VPEPTESDSYQFSYSRAKETAPLIAAQLRARTFHKSTNARTQCSTVRPAATSTRSQAPGSDRQADQAGDDRSSACRGERQIRTQSYGINWAGVVGSASSPQTLKFAGSDPAEAPSYQTTVNPVTGATQVITTPGKPAQGTVSGGRLQGNDFFLSKGLSSLAGQFAILSAPQLSVTLSALNQDNDAEFLANPRIVTADNMQAKIEITRSQPVPQLNFNEQTATAVFGGFQDKKFGNTLIVKPSVNKDNFITLAVKPEISNKVFDQPFTFAGATVTSPVIDTRTLDSNVMIKSGDTLAIGGLLQDEVSKARTKVPLMGDIPVLGYLFQSRTNSRVKRNLLVFVTPTIIDLAYGTGLEDQVSGIHHSGEEYADPNGWRNNAKGAVRLVPTSNRQTAAEYPKPGMPPAPAKTGSKVRFMADAKDRDF